MTPAEQLMELNSIKLEEKQILGLETDVFNRYPGAIASRVVDKGIVGWNGDARTTADGYPILGGYGVVQDVKGKTVVWNQYAGLITNELPRVFGEKPDASYVSVAYADNTMTATITTDTVTVKGFRFTKNLVRNHILLFVADAYKHTNDGVYCNIASFLVGNGSCEDQERVSLSDNDVWKRIYTRCVMDDTVAYLGIRVSNAATKDSYFSVKNLMLFDLTQMFGKGNEPTADEFFTMFPDEYYGISAPELMSVQGGNVKSVGRNLISEEDTDKILGASGWKKNEDGSYQGAINTLQLHTSVKKNYLFTEQFKIKGRFTFSFDYEMLINAGTNGYACFIFSDGTSNYSNGSATFGDMSGTCTMTSPEDKEVIGLYFTYGSSFTAKLSNMMLTRTTEKLPYEPYSCDSIDIDPTTILDSNGNQLFPFGLLSAGDVCDEITDGKAIKRVVAINIGNQEWSKASPIEGDGYCFTSKYGFNCNGASASSIANISCAKYTPDTRTNCLYSPINHDKIISFYTDKKIRIVDFSCDTAADFKSANENVYAYFELLEPIEVDILPFKYKVYDNGEEVYTPRTLEPKPDIRVGYKYDIEKLDGTDIEY